MADFSCFANVSNDSLSDIGWIVRHPDDLEFDTIGNGLAVAVIVTLLFLVGVPWNLFVICVILKKRLHSQPILMLMLNLAVTNLLVCVFVMPFNIVSGIKSEYVFGDSDLTRCRVCQTGIIVIILPWISVHTLCLMSVDRLIYLKRPMKYAKIVTSRRILAIIIAIWVLCTILALPPLFGFGEVNFSYTVATCVPFIVGSTPVAPNYFYIMLLLLEVLVPIITVFTMYVWIVCIISRSLARKLKRAAHSMTDNESKSATKQHSSVQLRLVRLFSIIFTANLVTWVPMIVLVLTGAILGARRIHTLVFSIAYLAYLSETVIHPILQAVLIREIRMIIYEVLSTLREVMRQVCFCGMIWKKWKNSSEASSVSLSCREDLWQDKESSVATKKDAPPCDDPV